MRDDTGRRPSDILFAVYSLASGAALAFPHRPAAWPALAALHLAAAALALRAPGTAWLRSAARTRAPRTTRLLHDWYPLLLVPVLYLELATLNRSVYDGRFFDSLILHWEALIFDGQPSRSLAAAVPDPLVSEILHAAYLSYYLLIYIPPLLLYAAGRLPEYRDALAALMLTFFVHYLAFIYFPVQGPRYLFPAPAGELAQGAMYRLAHTVLEAGSSQGAAFPSSHVAIAVAQCVITARYLPRVFPIVLALTFGLAIGAVYGGFHYAIDAVAGAALGLVLGVIAPRLRNPPRAVNIRSRDGGDRVLPSRQV